MLSIFLLFSLLLELYSFFDFVPEHLLVTSTLNNRNSLSFFLSLFHRSKQIISPKTASVSVSGGLLRLQIHQQCQGVGEVCRVEGQMNEVKLKASAGGRWEERTPKRFGLGGGVACLGWFAWVGRDSEVKTNMKTWKAFNKKQADHPRPTAKSHQTLTESTLQQPEANIKSL